MIFNSIRVRLQLWYGLILVVILTGFGFTAWQLERGHLLGRINAELERRAGFLAHALHPRPRGPERGAPERDGPDSANLPFDRPPPGQLPEDGAPDTMTAPPQDLRLPPETAGLFDAGDPNNFYFIIYARDGRELRRSTNAPPQALISPGSPPPVQPSAANPPREDRDRHPQMAQIQGDRVELELRTPPGVSIHVGCTVAPELKELRVVALKLVLAGGVILLLGLTGGWWLAGRAIRPIEDISATAAKISDGDLSRRISLAETESELGKLAAVLNSTFARLEAAFAQQKQFTSDAAHELRTPVTVMLTQTQLSLSRERNSAEYRQTIETCQRAAQRMRRLIESLLALARLDAGQEPIKHLKLDLAALAREGAEQVRPLAEERGITLLLETNPAQCAGDSERLARVLTNLLTNAIQYNRPNGEVRVTTRLENQTAVLAVRDTGAGIAAEDLPRIFERFYRSDKSRTTGGNGLGLSICKAILTAHGGSIDVASEPGTGTTFTVRLPAQ
jgi:heavy metal sensor kinase